MVGAMWEVGVGMTELEFDAADVSALADAGLVDVDPAAACVVPEVSTPLHRAAGRLQSVLPSGWLVDIDHAAPRPCGDPQPVLRVRSESH